MNQSNKFMWRNCLVVMVTTSGATRPNFQGGQIKYLCNIIRHNLQAFVRKQNKSIFQTRYNNNLIIKCPKIFIKIKNIYYLKKFYKTKSNFLLDFAS